jgi:hypothetical protein
LKDRIENRESNLVQSQDAVTRTQAELVSLYDELRSQIIAGGGADPGVITGYVWNAATSELTVS